MKVRFIILAISFSALAQIQHGSIGVVYLTDDEVVMAADSRGTIGGSHFDDQCKINALDGKILFVSTGNVVTYSNQVANPLGSVPSWNNYAEVRASYERIIQQFSTAATHMTDIAIDYASDLRSKWAGAAIYNRAFVSNAAAVQGGNRLTAAFFAGYDGSGKARVAQVLITFNERDLLNPVGMEVGLITCPVQNFCAIGRPEIVAEFLQTSTDRAMVDTKLWRPPSTTLWDDIDLERTVHLVELTIRYQGDDVGGEIDAVELDRGNDARWYRRKDNCPAN
jgi:hypothetical protein